MIFPILHSATVHNFIPGFKKKIILLLKSRFLVKISDQNFVKSCKTPMIVISWIATYGRSTREGKHFTLRQTMEVHFHILFTLSIFELEHQH